MSSKSHIAPVEAEPLAMDAVGQDPAETQSYPEEEWLEEEPAQLSRSLSDWLLPSAAMLIVLGWTAFFGWVHQEQILSGATANVWVGWISQWSVPVLLVVAVWLLVMRNSRREAARFADAGQALSLEAARLEERLTTVNRELSLAREFITAQSRDLESFGRLASERLSENADRLQALVQDNGAQVNAIASVSATALENMDKLRSDLPVIANSARDTANQIGNAGRTAHKQLETMIEGMDRLNQFGKASEQQIVLVRQKVDEALATFEARSAALEQIAEGRFAELARHGDEFRALLDTQEVEALAAIRRRAQLLADELQQAGVALQTQEMQALENLQSRIAMLRDEGGSAARSLCDAEADALAAARERMSGLMVEIDQFAETLADRSRLFIAQLAERRDAAAAQDDAELARIEQTFVQFDQRAAKLREAQEQAQIDLVKQGEELAAKLVQLQGEMREISSLGGIAGSELAENIRNLAKALTEGRQSLSGTEQQVSELTNASVRLLELIHASAQHSKEALPLALDHAERKLADFRTQAEALGSVLEEASAQGGKLAENVAASRREGEAVIEEFDAFYSRLMGRNRDHVERLAELRSQLSVLSRENEEKAATVTENLSQAITGLQQSARSVIDEMAAGSDRVVTELISRISDRSAEAMDHIMQDNAAVAVGKLEAAASRAAAMGREAAIQLRDQLARVDELASNLEARVAHARERAEEQVDNDFARRVALITEALNSNAIDIAKALSNDVTDTAWASYLKGDRGIFTRRAVRLVDNSESRTIAEIYENDPDFREHVSRYVHDFEAMMRTLLSTRDGHALSVTLLSSDMGKLYVVLAQSIDRLRN